MNERVAAIDRCMREIEQARAGRAWNPVGAMLGELDWLSELHRLLYVQTSANA